jgi:2-keto-3-deoxy-L-rhamnonate aldolase RhmA
MFAGTTDIARRWMDEGYQFVTVSCDLSVLEGATQEILSKLHAVSG